MRKCKSNDKAKDYSNGKTNAGVLRFAQNDNLKTECSDGDKDSQLSGEDEVEDDENGEDGDGESRGLLVPAQMAFDGFGG